MREFFEETGVDFRLPAVQAQYGVMMPLPPPFDQRPAYSVTFLEIAAANIGALQAAITANIAGSIPGDDELYSVFWEPRNTAPARFGVSPNPPNPASWQYPQFNAVTPVNVPRRDRQMAAPFDWFVTGAQNCP
jgi:hypothetical protein